MDRKLRELQRRSDAGDPEALAQLARETLRAVSVLGLVTGLSEDIQAALAEATLSEALVERVTAGVLESIDIPPTDELVDPSDVADYVDLREIASYIDPDDVASEVEVYDVAQALDVDDVASHIDLDTLADKLASDQDFLDSLAERLTEEE